ncbi:TPA: lytic transglycosylase domain-containing protein [Candidatus Micrarchaeota archaeon]|nr:lytic transglycosylase domain-containing protein [Candidatus Micrarchaeota archaeon]
MIGLQTSKILLAFVLLASAVTLAIAASPSSVLPSDAAVLFLGEKIEKEPVLVSGTIDYDKIRAALEASNAPSVDVGGLDVAGASEKSGNPVPRTADYSRAFNGGTAGSFPSGARIPASCPSLRNSGGQLCIASPEVSAIIAKYAPQLNNLQSKVRVEDPFKLACAVALQESCYGKFSRSKAGALGLMQIMPATGMGECGLSEKQLLNYDSNVWCGIKYLAKQLNSFGSVELALAAYNAGPGAVARRGGIPQNGETPTYVASICSNYHYSCTT